MTERRGISLPIGDGDTRRSMASRMPTLLFRVVDPNKRGHDLPLAADTLVQFDSNAPCEILYDRVPITEVDYRKVQLIPRGGTPLLDAIGKATTHLMER